MSMSAAGVPVAYQMLNPPAIYGQASEASKPEYVRKFIGFKEALELFDGCLDKDKKKDGKISKDEFVEGKFDGSLSALLSTNKSAKGIFEKNLLVFNALRSKLTKEYGNEFDRFYDRDKDGFITIDDDFYGTAYRLRIEVIVPKK